MSTSCTLRCLFMLSAILLSLTPNVLAQSFTSCTGQTVLSISGANTSTIQNQTGSPVNVRITAIGADGGNETACCGLIGGSGAIMVGEFVLANNATIRAISGSRGATSSSGGGGAGSGAVDCGNPSDCANGTIMLIAAGGGGAFGGGLSGIGGSSGTSNGSGGTNSGNAGGGGGVNANGMPYPTGNYGGIVSKTGLSGGVGNGGRGMGSGGGSTGGGGAGGGGGHTGGSAAAGSAAFSFNSGSNQNNTSGAEGAGALSQGSVEIVCLSFALPVELVDFSAQLKGPQVQLYWRTATEQANLGYTIEKSADARNWLSLDFVAGAGTSTSVKNYTYTDVAPYAGMNYYRLRQTDFDGRSEFSPILIVDAGLGDKPVSLFPNPAYGGMSAVYFPEVGETEIQIEVFDWLGNKVHQQNTSLPGGKDQLLALELQNLPVGMYSVRVQYAGKQFTEKLLIK